jgi:hypothetical protein
VISEKRRSEYEIKFILSRFSLASKEKPFAINVGPLGSKAIPFPWGFP